MLSQNQFEKVITKAVLNELTEMGEVRVEKDSEYTRFIPPGHVADACPTFRMEKLYQHYVEGNNLGSSICVIVRRIRNHFAS